MGTDITVQRKYLLFMFMLIFILTWKPVLINDKVFYQIIQYDNQSERYLQLFNSHEKYFMMNLFIDNVKFVNNYFMSFRNFIILKYSLIVDRMIMRSPIEFFIFKYGNSQLRLEISQKINYISPYGFVFFVIPLIPAATTSLIRMIELTC